MFTDQVYITREDVLVSYCVETNGHKLSGFKQHKFIVILFWTSEVQYQAQWTKIKMLQDCVSSLEVLGENPFSCLF